MDDALALDTHFLGLRHHPCGPPPGQLLLLKVLVYVCPYKVVIAHAAMSGKEKNDGEGYENVPDECAPRGCARGMCATSGLGLPEFAEKSLGSSKQFAPSAPRS